MTIRAFYYIALILIFAIAAFFIITYAAGYKIDIESRNISQMGMIIVQSDNAQIALNSELVGNDKATIRNLKPGIYQIRLTKEGYQPWTKDIDLEPGEAQIINDGILFKAKPEIKEYKLSETDFFNKLSDSDSLSTQSNELYQNGNFVTRLMGDIKGASWYSDRRYIAYTYRDQLKIIQIDGTNEIALLEKKSDTPVVFLNSGRSVVYESDGKIYKADIR